jgi:hypothetical protein
MHHCESIACSPRILLPQHCHTPSSLLLPLPLAPLLFAAPTVCVPFVLRGSTKSPCYECVFVCVACSLVLLRRSSLVLPRCSAAAPASPGVRNAPGRPRDADATSEQRSAAQCSAVQRSGARCAAPTSEQGSGHRGKTEREAQPKERWRSCSAHTNAGVIRIARAASIDRSRCSCVCVCVCVKLLLRTRLAICAVLPPSTALASAAPPRPAAQQHRRIASFLRLHSMPRQVSYSQRDSAGQSGGRETCMGNGVLLTHRTNRPV